MTINVISGPVVSAGVNDTLCIDDAQITLVGSPAGGTWSGVGIIDVNLGIFDPLTAGAGLHTITYTQGTGTCEKSDDITILVGALPTINAGINQLVCINNADFQLSGFSPQGGTWSGTGIINGSLGIFSPATAGAGTFTLTYVYANPVTGCDNFATKQIRVAPLTAVVATDVTFCDNTNDISLNGLGAPNNGTWSGAGVVNANGVFNTNIAGGIGTYTLTYTFTNDDGCTNSDNMNVNVIYGDTVEAGPDIAMCVTDGLINMTGYSPLGGTWSGNGIIDANNGTFNPSLVTIGFHTLTYTFGTGSCLKTDTRTIYVGDIPAVTAGPDFIICQQADSITISSASPSGGFWTGNGVSSNGGFVPQNMSVGTFKLAYTYVNTTSGCRNADTLAVTVEAPPVVDAGPDDVYCLTNQNIVLSGQTPATGGLWNGPGIVNGITGLFNTQTAGGLGYNNGDTTYQVVYTYTANNGCFNRDTLNITVEFGEFVDAGLPDTLCINHGQFVLGGYTPLNGKWSGTGITDPNLGIFNTNISGTGTHTLTYTYGVGTCLKSDTKTIFVDALPLINAGVDQTLCIDNGLLTLSGYTPQGGLWSGTGIIDPNAGIFDPTVSNLGTFTLVYTFANPITGCSDSDTKLVRIVPLPNVTAGGVVTYCNTPDQITIGDYTAYSPNNGVWSGPGIIDANDGIFSTVLAGGLAWDGSDTTYNLTYTYTDAEGCDNSDILTVTVTYGDTVLAGSNQSVCIDAGFITLTNFSPLNGTWSGPGIINSAGIFDPTAAGLGTHILTYTFGSGTCLKTASKTIFVGEPPVISAGVDQTVCIDNGLFQIQGFSPFGGVWTGTGVSANGIFDPSVGVGVYNLTYTFINSVTGCQAFDTKKITVAPLPSVTTASTALYCNIASNITLTGYTPAGGVWTGPGIVDGNLALFNTTQAGGLATNGADTTYTLTYTYTDGNGCINSNTTDVTVTFGDTVVAGTNEATCIDAGLLFLTGFSPAGGTFSGTGIIDAVAGVFDPALAGGGTHVITYTFGTGTCEKESVKTIFVGTDPIVEAGPNLSRCIDVGLFQLTNYSPLGGIWSGVGITDAINGFFNPAVAGAGTWTLTYTYTNSITGCQASDTRTVTINPLPIVTAPNTLEFCNTTTNITLSGFAPLGGTWIGTGVVDQNNGVFNTTIAGGIGVYNLEYRYTDINGCTNNDNTIINVIFGDTVEAGPNLAVCISDAPLLLTGFQPVGGTWTGTGITDPSGVFDPQIAGPGLHKITISFGTGTCLKTDTRDVFVGEIPNVIAGANQDVCGQNADFMLTGFSPPGGYWIGNGVDSSGLFSPIGATPGTWTLTYTYVNPITGCQNSATKVIFVETPPAVDAGGTVTYCNSTNNITLNQHSPLGGVWSGSGIVDGLNGIFNTTAAGGLGYNGADTTYFAYYEFTSSTGCFGRDTLEIVVEFGDTVYAGVDDTICIDEGQLNLTGFSPAGGTWSGNGIIDNVLGIFDPVAAGAGLHTLSYTYGVGTCQKTDNKRIFVGALPFINPGIDELVCVDEAPFALSNFSPQGGSWVGVGVTSAGVFNPALAGVGTWTLTYIFTNSITGCDNSATKKITVAPLPAVNVGDTVQYCNTPSDIILSGYSPNGGSWSGTGVVSANAGVFSTILAGGIGVYNLTYSFTDANGCSNRDTLVVDVIYGDTVNAGPDRSICITDGLITLSGYSPASGGAWSGTGIIDANAGIFDPNLAGGGTHVLTYTYGVGTCQKTDTRTIFVGTVPAVNAGPDILVCADQTAFTLNTFSPTGGIWSGTGITNATMAVFDPQVTGVGTFTLVYDYLNSVTGCENFDTRNVVVAPLPIVDITDSLEFCINNNNIPLNTYVSTTPSTGLVWSGSGIVDPTNGIFNATIAGGIGQYAVVIEYTDANGCSNQDTLAIDIIFGDTVEAGPDDTLCVNDNPILLTGYSPIGGAFSGAGVDAISGTFDPGLAGAGLHIITYTYGTGTCQKTDTRQILVGSLPSINIGPNQTVCISGGAFTLSGYSPQGGIWSGVGITDPNAGIFNIASAGVGTHILTYTFANSITGCENTAQRTITVAPLPVVEAGNPTLICDNPNDFTIPSATYYPSGGTWSGQGIVNSSAGVFNTVIAGGLGFNNADTTYSVVYSFTDGNNCTNSDILEITVEFGDSILAGPNEALCIDIGLHQLTGFLPTTNGIWTGPGISDPINGIFDPQAAGPGAHTITISTGIGTCAKSDDKIIFVGTPPAVNPGNNQAVCEDDVAFALTGFSPPGGIWTGVGITDTVNAIFDPQVSGIGTFVLTYTFVNSITNCETVATKQVTVNPLPFVDAGDTVTYCNNPNNIILSGYTPSAGGFWSGLGVVSPSQGVFNTVQAGGIGIYNLTYDYTNPFTGCQSSDTLVIDVIYGDTVLAGPNDTLCIQDLPIILQGSPAGGIWSGTGITNGNLGIFNPAVAKGGTHIMTYTYGLESCQKTDTKIIFVGEPDPLNAGNDRILCVDAPPVTLTASLPTGVWSGNGITNTITGQFNPGVALVGFHNIVYTYTNPVTGCVSMDTLVIEVKPLPVVNTAGAVTYCEWPLNVQLPTPNLTPGVWSGAGIVDINNGLFNSIVAGGLGSNGVDTIYPITYTHTNAFGCSNSDILNITITYGDSVLAGPDIITCIDDSPITLIGSPLGGTWSGFGITDPTGIFNPAVGVGGGNFNVTYTQGTGTCVKSDVLTVTVIDVTGTTAGPDEDFCYEDGLVTLSGNSPLGGVWTGPGIQNGNLGTFLTQAVSTGVVANTVQVCYTYVDALSGCDYTDCKNVTVRPLPTAGFTMVDTACVNDVVSFANTSVDAISFKWYFGDGDSSNFLSPTHVYGASGLYTTTLVAYSDFGCPDTLRKDILIYEIPQAGFNLSTNDGCGPLTVSFTNTTTNQNQNLTYSWDFGNGLTSVQANPPAQTYNAGVEDTTYTVSLTVTNLCGTTTFTRDIIVRARPNVIFAADDNYGCGPLVVNFSNASTGGPNSYLWNFGPFGASTDTIPPPVAFTINDTIPVTYIVTLTATNACGTDVGSLTITVIPGSLNAGFGTSVTEGCEPLTVDFTSAVQMGDNVQWIFGDGNGSILHNPTHVFDTVGTFTVLQIVSNQCGSDTATINITVHPQPPMSISHAPFVCVGQPMQFYNNSNPIAGTQWAFGDGGSSSLTNPTHVFTTPGLYTVYVTNYSITHLCPITDSTVVEVKEIPNASFSVDDMSGCSPVTVNFTNNSTGLFNSWMFINGPGTDTTFSILLNPTHTFIEAGQHYVVLRTSDQFGCYEDTTLTGIVVYPDPVATFVPSVAQQCGLEATVTLQNYSTDANAYFWDFGNGTFSNVTTPTISYNNIGDHTIFLEASNLFGCKDTMIDQITVYPLPNADFDVQPQMGCEPLTVQFIQLATNTDGYLWRFGDGEISTEANPIHTYSAGVYNVTFIASINGVCFDSLVMVDAVFAQNSPFADFEIIQSDPNNPTGVIQFVNNTVGATRYEWEFGDGTFSNERNPSKEYLENGQRIVRLIAWNDLGCSDTLVKVIEPNSFKGLFVPNAFSPDAGIGDVRLFKPVGVNIETYRAQVFSQWGELLWESEALDDAGRPTEGWDGIYKGIPMPQGAYVWKVDAVFKDGSIWEGQKNTLGQTRKLGSVTLLR
jgi:large repetitive protein